MSNVTVTAHSNKRKRGHSHSSISSEQSSRHKQITKPLGDVPILIKYPFLLPLVLQYLGYDDVLNHVMLLNRSIKQTIPSYHVKQQVKYFRACRALESTRSFILTLDSLANVTTYHLARFEGVRILHFSGCAAPAIPPHLIPHSVTAMHLDNNHEGPFYSDSLPPRLTHLRCGDSYDKPFTPGLLPATLECLVTGDSFDMPLQPGSLPDNLKVLLFGQEFIQPLPLEVIPTSLTSLEFGIGYDLPLVLPASLTELILCTPYKPDHTFPQGFPPALTKLKLGTYNGWQDKTDPMLPAGSLPATVTDLSFYQPVTVGSIPSSVTRLTWYPDVLSAGLIPNSVTHLTLFSREILPGLIPRSVRKLVVMGNLIANSIPDSVESLVLHGGPQNQRPLEIGVIPGSVTHLQWHRYNFDIQVRRLPVMTEHGREFVLISAIPASVTHLKLVSFNRPLVPGAIPGSVIYLDLGRGFNQPLLPGSIPDSVKQLELLPSYNRSFLPSGIPATTQVTFGSNAEWYEEAIDYW